jgi:hypothetical protein
MNDLSIWIKEFFVQAGRTGAEDFSWPKNFQRPTDNSLMAFIPVK